MKAILVIVMVCLGGLASAQPKKAKNVKVTIVSTMLSGSPGKGIGEWGFAALVEADGRRILFDTGGRPDTVLQNAGEMKIDLAGVTDVVLTHWHGDHIGGLIKLREEIRKKDPKAMSRVSTARTSAARISRSSSRRSAAPGSNTRSRWSSRPACG